MLFASQERGTRGIGIVPRVLWVLVPTRMMLVTSMIWFNPCASEDLRLLLHPQAQPVP